jgi:hypothetical protein
MSVASLPTASGNGIQAIPSATFGARSCPPLREGNGRESLARGAGACAVSGASTFLARVAGALDRGGVPYMLAGSFASSFHGAPRATQDIDIVVDPTFESLDRFLDALTGDGVYFDADVAREEFKRRGQFNVIDGSTAWKADVIFRKARPFSKEEIARRVAATVLGVDVFVATAEDTVLAKLECAKLGESERQARRTWASGSEG